MNKFYASFRYWDASCSLPRRIYEWIVITGFFSISFFIPFNFIALVTFPGASPYMDASMTHSWLILPLGLFWWVTISIFFERTARYPDAPKDAANLNQSIGRIFIMTPLFVFIMAYATATLSMPLIASLTRSAVGFASNLLS